MRMGCGTLYHVSQNTVPCMFPDFGVDLQIFPIVNDNMLLCPEYEHTSSTTVFAKFSSGANLQVLTTVLIFDIKHAAPLLSAYLSLSNHYSPGFSLQIHFFISVARHVNTTHISE